MGDPLLPLHPPQWLWLVQAQGPLIGAAPLLVRLQQAMWRAGCWLLQGPRDPLHAHARATEMTACPIWLRFSGWDHALGRGSASLPCVLPSRAHAFSGLLADSLITPSSPHGIASPLLLMLPIASLVIAWLLAASGCEEWRPPNRLERLRGWEAMPMMTVMSVGMPELEPEAQLPA